MIGATGDRAPARPPPPGSAWWRRWPATSRAGPRPLPAGRLPPGRHPRPASTRGSAGRRRRPTLTAPTPCLFRRKTWFQEGHTGGDSRRRCGPSARPCRGTAPAGRTPSSDTRPRVVFSPTTPQHAAGIRIEPPVSLPKATSASPAPTATAEPLDEPPGTSLGVERVDRRSEPRVDPGHPERQLVQVGLADHHHGAFRLGRPGAGQAGGVGAGGRGRGRR